MSGAPAREDLGTRREFYFPEASRLLRRSPVPVIIKGSLSPFQELSDITEIFFYPSHFQHRTFV